MSPENEMARTADASGSGRATDPRSQGRRVSAVWVGLAFLFVGILILANPPGSKGGLRAWLRRRRPSASRGPDAAGPGLRGG